MNPVTDRGRIVINEIELKYLKVIINLIYDIVSGDCDLSVTG